MNVLISGASMAGLSAAWWFSRLGHRVTVVERADGLRPGSWSFRVHHDRLLAELATVGAVIRVASIRSFLTRRGSASSTSNSNPE